MATNVNKISSNVTGLAYAEEESIGVLPVTPNWIGLEPNSYSEFGGNLTLLARNPITAGRQRKKGVITDLDASAGFNTDLTQDNLQDLLQGFFFADIQTHVQKACSAVTNTPNKYTITGGGTSVFPVGAVVLMTGFTNSLNNGIKNVTASDATSITVSETTVAEVSPPAAARIELVGFVGFASDLKVTGATGSSFPKITAMVTANFINLGIKVGEWIFVGGDTPGSTAFTDPKNNGFKRVLSRTTTEIVIDKSDDVMVTEAVGATKYVTIYFGRMLMNRTGTDIVRRTYQLERLLGAPDTTAPTEIQSEYIVGAVPNKFDLTIAPATKIACDLSFVATDFEQRTGAQDKKTGTDNRTITSQADAFNTSSDFSRVNLSVVTNYNEAVTPLFAFVTDLKLSIDNGVTPDKAVGVLGAFDMSEGDFMVNGSMTAYFADTEAVAAVRNNSNVTLDFAIVKNNAGIVVDVPLLALGDGRLNLEKDKSITLPLSFEAATASAISSTTDYTLSMCFFPYLPNAADIAL